jgi:hypothetical protein
VAEPPRRPRGLRPLRTAQPSARAAEAETEARLKDAWPLVVGAALAPRTRLLRVRRGILVIGTWDLSRIQALRQAAAAAWPEVRARIQRFLRIELAGLEVEPCDAPEVEVPALRGDPLKALLARVRKG